MKKTLLLLLIFCATIAVSQNIIQMQIISPKEIMESAQVLGKMVFADHKLKIYDLQDQLIAEPDFTPDLIIEIDASEIQSLNLDFILDERGREFYAEGYRRSDLIRFGKYGGNTGYQWEGKSGKWYGADFPQYMNLYPIPASLLPSMYKGQQNPGY